VNTDRSREALNTRALALIVVFTALAAALNIYGPKIPFPFAPFLFFTFWEIPIVIAFFMAGPRSGLIVSVINTLILLVVFPGALPTGPLYNLIAVVAMLSGIYLPYWIIKKGSKSENLGSYLSNHIVLIGLSSTTFGIILRVLVMTIFNYFALQQPFPIGFEFEEVNVLLFLPIGAIFNAVVALYSILIAIGVTVAVMPRFKM
jgi:riboflavin transporter FmnP